MYFKIVNAQLYAPYKYVQINKSISCFHLTSTKVTPTDKNINLKKNVCKTGSTKCLADKKNTVTFPHYCGIDLPKMITVP